jgi:hypothetical protein
MKNFGELTSLLNVSGLSLGRRVLHLFSQQLELGLRSNATQVLPVDVESAVSQRTLKQPSVRAMVVSRHFFSQPNRGIVTKAAGGLPEGIKAAKGWPCSGYRRRTVQFGFQLQRSS